MKLSDYVGPLSFVVVCSAAVVAGVTNDIQYADIQAEQAAISWGPATNGVRAGLAQFGALDRSSKTNSVGAIVFVGAEAANAELVIFEPEDYLCAVDLKDAQGHSLQPVEDSTNRLRPLQAHVSATRVLQQVKRRQWRRFDLRAACPFYQLGTINVGQLFRVESGRNYRLTVQVRVYRLATNGDGVSLNVLPAVSIEIPKELR